MDIGTCIAGCQVTQMGSGMDPHGPLARRSSSVSGDEAEGRDSDDFRYLIHVFHLLFNQKKKLIWSSR